MSGETPFRLALAVMLVATMFTAGYHRVQAAKSREKLSRRGEGRLLFLSIRLMGLALVLTTLTYLVHPAWMRWASVPLPVAARWGGAGLGLLGALLLAWTLITLGKNLTDTVVTRINHSLVTCGPYRWVRHPFYVSLLVLVGAAFLLSANWAIGLSGLAAFALLALRTPIEERNLIERFGEEYRKYMARTGRFTPRIPR